MYKKKVKVKIISIILIILSLNSLNFINSVKAISVDNTNINSVEDCGALLKYKGMIVKTFYAEYTGDGKRYPAYCLDKTKTGVSDQNPSYSVSIENAINDVKLWRILINGYPYKTIEELGVANREEAFTATKQAVYTYVHNNQLGDYEAIGEAGKRTLNALYKIVNNANNSNEVQISNRIDISKIKDEWEQDNVQLEYVYKKYKVTANTRISNYKVKIDKATKVEGIKIVDEKNNEKEEFLPNEIFKILVPIKNLKEDGEIKISIDTQVETKPILYGRASSSNLQDYALTASTYEDGKGEISDKYGKNETKIIIIKQDENTGERIDGTEFQILDENKNVLYTNLKTDKDGIIKVENLIPGKYYIKETKAKDGYELYKDLIEVDISLNEEFSVNVNNSKTEKPSIEKIQEIKEVKNKKILPVTGM